LAQTAIDGAVQTCANDHAALHDISHRRTD